MANRIADPAVYTTKTTLGGGELIHSNDANQDRLFSVDTLATYINNKALPPGYIDGLYLLWVSNTAITVTSGAAYIPSLSLTLKAPSDIAKTGLSLSANTFYHVYLYRNGSTPDVEIVTTAPSSTYNGMARTKSGDTSRRYIGSVLTDSSGNIFGFKHVGDTITYQRNVATSPFRVLGNGTATTSTTVVLSLTAPVTSRSALIACENPTGSGQVMRVGNVDSTDMIGMYPGNIPVFNLAMNSSQQLSYRFLATPSVGGNIDVLGYSYAR